MQQSASEKTVGMSIADWHQAALDGVDLPVRFQVNGSSMYPLIRRNRDYVTVVPLRRAPKVGDIVLFYRESKADYVLHRVWKVKGDMVQTFGDGCTHPDSWMDAKNLRGIVIQIERGKAVFGPYVSSCSTLRWWSKAYGNKKLLAFSRQLIFKLKNIAQCFIEK